MKYYSGPISDHYDGRRFFNAACGYNTTGHFFECVRYFLFKSMPKWQGIKQLCRLDTPPDSITGLNSTVLRVSFIGHCTVLLQTCGVNILLDPVWSHRLGPLKLGPKRWQEPGILFDQLPKIDVVLVSHNHYDHMDLPTLKKLWRRDRPLIFLPLGNDKILSAFGIDSIPLDWGDSYRAVSDISVGLEPAFHWSSRFGILDMNRALWGSFIIRSRYGNICFVGDSAYGDGRYYREIKKKYGDIQFAILPIGDYLPKHLMSRVHQSPEEAVLAHIDLGAKYSMVTHFGVFRLSATKNCVPVVELREAMQKYSIPMDRFLVLGPGDFSVVPSSNN